MRALGAYLRSLNPQLPRVVWLLQAGGLANAFGNGLVLPFILIYLHNVRGIPVWIAGLVAATNGLVALVTGPLAGAAADRFGPRRTLAAALVVMAVAASLFPLIEETWHAFVLNGLLGAGSGAFWPSQSALLTGLTPRDRRPAAFAQQRVTMNLGIGFGGLTGGLIATTSDPDSFTTLFLLDAATFLVFAVVLSRIRAPRAEHARDERGGYRGVLADRPFVGFVLLNMTFIAATIALMAEMFPVFAKNEASVSERGIGLIFFLNTVLIVVVQLPIAKLQEGRRRMTAFAIMGVVFAASWLLVLAGGLWLEAAAATAVFAAAFLVFAVAECLHGAIQGPLVSDLARPGLVGRYMALSSSSWQLAFIVGPAAGGAILDANAFALWPVAAAVCLLGAGLALRLESALPREARRTPATRLPHPTPPVPASVQAQVLGVELRTP